MQVPGRARHPQLCSVAMAVVELAVSPPKTGSQPCSQEEEDHGEEIGEGKSFNLYNCNQPLIHIFVSCTHIFCVFALHRMLLLKNIEALALDKDTGSY